MSSIFDVESLFDCVSDLCGSSQLNPLAVSVCINEIWNNSLLAKISTFVIESLFNCVFNLCGSFQLNLLACGVTFNRLCLLCWSIVNSTIGIKYEITLCQTKLLTTLLFLTKYWYCFLYFKSNRSIWFNIVLIQYWHR